MESWREEFYASDYGSEYLAHHGIKGQRWGIRRYQNPDGTLTPEGLKRYGYGDETTTYDRSSGEAKKTSKSYTGPSKEEIDKIAEAERKLKKIGIKGKELDAVYKQYNHERTSYNVNKDGQKVTKDSYDMTNHRDDFNEKKFVESAIKTIANKRISDAKVSMEVSKKIAIWLNPVQAAVLAEQEKRWADPGYSGQRTQQEIKRLTKKYNRKFN